MSNFANNLPNLTPASISATQDTILTQSSENSLVCGSGSKDSDALPPKRSKFHAWCFKNGYARRDGINIKCLVKGCGKTLISSRGSTSSINHHLMIHHKIRNGVENFNFPTKIYGVTRDYNPSNNEIPFTKRFNKTIAKYMLKHSLPFTHLESDEFRQLIAESYCATNAELLVPLTAKSFRGLLDDYFEELKPKVISLLKNQKSVSLTLDMWSSSNNYGFMGIVAHFINDNWESKSIVIGMEHIPGSHTSKALSRALLNVIEEFEIQEKLFSITTDSDNTMKAMGRDLDTLYPQQHNISFNYKKQHIPCFAHIINLVCQAAIEVGFQSPAWIMEDNGDTILVEQSEVNGKKINKILSRIRSTIVSIR